MLVLCCLTCYWMALGVRWDFCLFVLVAFCGLYDALGFGLCLWLASVF